jgi:CRP-like cAMP-binding protein
MDAAGSAILGLTQCCGLTPRNAATIRLLTRRPEYYAAGALIGTASAAPRPKLIVSGWASELRVLRDGRYQIFSFLLPGDVVLSQSARASKSCTLVALTPVTCIDVERTVELASPPERDALREVMDLALTIAKELRYDVVRRMCLSSRVARVAHLLLGLHDRLAVVGLASDGFEMPLTHQQIAHSSGLTPAQVRRSLRFLEAKKLATVRSGRVTEFDELGLRTIFGLQTWP